MDEKDNVKKILDELNKALDEIIKKEKQSEDISKNAVETVKPKQLVSDDTKQKYDEVVKSETEPVSVPVTSQQSHLDTQKDIDKNKIKQITSGPAKVEQQIQQDTIVKNAVFIYPTTIGDAKEMFFNNINDTLSRVAKDRIKVVPSLVIEYTSFKNFLLEYENKIKEAVKTDALFLIVNEQSDESTNFISHVSPYFSVVKVISLKELKMRSTYLDISIDLLLTTK